MRALVTITLAITLSGCTDEYVKTSWTSPTRTAQQMNADLAYCMALANSGGTTQTNIVMPQALPPISTGFSGGLSSGLGNGMMLGAAIAQRQQRERQQQIQASCMIGKGYQ